MITHDRWLQIKAIFYSALDLAPAERSAFLNKVCRNDTATREEVETLLAADAETDDFLNEPAYEFAQGMIADEPREFSAGQEVGQYKIDCFLSSGGMGQIYEARDTELGRKVALKFISPEYAKDRRRVQRFEQEARAASALNHPNVCVIHQVGVTDNDRHFIAMEFIVGSTLRDLLAQQTFSPLQALKTITQVGDALASAHAKGIVHRDIKPENIMLRPDGYVKVVDFGLAKLTEILPERHTDEAETMFNTEPHLIMGTVRYMSPEQLKEAPVDERTDIWSLGTVLYEMLTGVTPFNARAPNESIALILTSEPELNKIPIQLRAIIKKALEKDCAQRYQTVTKLTADLNKVKWQLEHSDDEGYITSVAELPTAPITHGSAIFTRLRTQAVITADSLFGEIKTHKTVTIFAATFALFLLLLYLLPRSANPFQNLAMAQLTDQGTSVCAAMSPDGTWVAHAEQQQNGKQNLTLTNTTTPPPNEFIAVPAEEVRYLGISFSSDGHYLYFTRTEKNDDDGILYRLELSNRNLIKLKEGVDSPISFSPQGDRFAFVRYDEARTEFSLVVSDIAGTSEQVVATRKDGDTLSLFGVAWSPEGNMVICPTGDWKNGWQMKLVGFDVKDGHEQQIGNQPWFSVQQIAWYPDMSGLVVSATARQTAPHQLWWIPFPGGEMQKVTSDLSDYLNVSLAGKKIVTVQADRQWRIWVVPIDNVDRATPIANGVGLYFGLSWTSKGKIVYAAMAQDRLNLLEIDNGGHKTQLTFNGGDNFMPASSPDGRFIVFVSNQNGAYNIWRMNTDDSRDLKQLTFSDGNFYPSVSPDNQWVAYDNVINSSTSILKVPLAGGEPVKVGERYRMPVFSPDNQFIAGRYDQVSGTRDAAIFPAQGGLPWRYFKVPVQEWQSIQWLPTGQVSYVKNIDGYSNIWTYDLDTGAEKQITYFNTDQIYAYAWSPDYKQLACLRGSKLFNIAIMK